MQLPMQPLSDVHGFDRGTPVDRYYIERFLKAHASLITGDAAELKNDKYLRKFGGINVNNTTVIDIDPTNPQATLVVDLTDEESLPAESFDCIVCTQALQFFTRVDVALANFFQGLRPGGTLLLTVPAVGRLSVSIPEDDLWRVNPSGARLLFASWDGPVELDWFGNLRVCIAMLMGEPAEELTAEELEFRDHAFPLVTCVVARRP
jgi:SAM-dependent methyltransferase